MTEPGVKQAEEVGTMLPESGQLGLGSIPSWFTNTWSGLGTALDVWDTKPDGQKDSGLTAPCLVGRTD